MAETSLMDALRDAGLGSRRAVSALIKSGRVGVNGLTVTAFGYRLDSARDTVLLDGVPVGKPPGRDVYLVVNKPAGVLSTTRDERGRRTVMDILPEKYRIPGLHLAGRLDLESRGLIIVTSDGRLTYRLTHPKFEKEKEYRAQLDRPMSPENLKEFESGLLLEEGVTAPAVIKPVRLRPPVYRVIIHEGRKRQVRRMFQTLGYRVGDLSRVRIGSLRLGSLPEGALRELRAGEVEALYSK
jgi:23S rRNA pseudouridine2605 synthase